ncbi:hypothetical protein [Aeromonas dhakensis]|uniref:hypothetical protein n=1 Tax=Aeromonas dhakensis TaxID=196024 RepID=UPI002441DE71|nr:hypothetical protein [Aeromonas dhakensis]
MRGLLIGVGQHEVNAGQVDPRVDREHPLTLAATRDPAGGIGAEGDAARGHLQPGLFAPLEGEQQVALCGPQGKGAGGKAELLTLQGAVE